MTNRNKGIDGLIEKTLNGGIDEIKTGHQYSGNLYKFISSNPVLQVKLRGQHYLIEVIENKDPKFSHFSNIARNKLVRAMKSQIYGSRSRVMVTASSNNRGIDYVGVCVAPKRKGRR